MSLWPCSPFFDNAVTYQLYLRELVVLAPASEKEAVHHGASKFRVIERLLMQIEDQRSADRDQRGGEKHIGAILSDR